MRTCRHTLHSLVALAAIGLIPTSAGAQTQCNAVNTPSLVSESSPRADPTGVFCDGGIDGSEACVGNTNKVEFFLQLESVEKVDLSCRSENGVLCVMDATCTQLITGGNNSTIRLSGALDSTDLRLVASDDDAGTLCDNGLSTTITCTGSFGGRAIIDTNFEEAFELQGWSVGECPNCVASTAMLAAGGSFFADLGFTVAGPTEHLALLEPSGDLEAELVLLRREGIGWVEVARGASYGRLRVVSWTGPAGTYRWEVRGVAGRGAFTLWRSPPLAVAEGASR